MTNDEDARIIREQGERIARLEGRLEARGDEVAVYRAETQAFREESAARIEAYRAEVAAWREQDAARFERLTVRFDRTEERFDRLDAEVGAIARKLFGDDDGDGA